MILIHSANENFSFSRRKARLDTSSRVSSPCIETDRQRNSGMSELGDFDPDTINVSGEHFIDGALTRACDPELEVLRPSDHRRLGITYDASESTVDRAVESAAEAFKSSGWADQPPRERARVLRRWAEAIEANAETLARIESAGSTRLINETRLRDVLVGADLIRYYAEYADKLEGAITPTGAKALSLVVNEPYGVVGAIVPWNFPLINACMKIAPALAAGNALVLKPSEMTPFSLAALARLSLAAGLPKGILNVVNGEGPKAGAALVRHPKVRKISFTGSTATGARIMADAAASGVKPVVMELGGKSPIVVFADAADLDAVARNVLRAFTYNGGQVCTAGSRLVVARKVKDELVGRVAKLAGEAKAGPTWRTDSSLPPVISAKQLQRIESLIHASVAEGARVVTGGGRVDSRTEGAYLAPTILDEVKAGMTAHREEFFGPVLSVQSFEEVDEAIELADHPVYGLAASVFTSDIDKALRLSRAIEAGTVWVNQHGRPADLAPPAGGYKGSGFGKDWGRAGIEGYLRQKAIWFAQN
jgi:aldehyde dehydrogenase (NAD+)